MWSRWFGPSLRGYMAHVPSTDVLAALVVVLLVILVRIRRLKKLPHVVSLFIYPVKSCKEQNVDTVAVTPRGFAFDRRFQVVDSAGEVCTPRDDRTVALFKISAELTSESLTLTAANLEPLTISLATARTKVAKCAVIASPHRHPLLNYGEAASNWFEKCGLPGCRLVGMPDHSQRTACVNPKQGEAVPTRSPAPVSLADEAPVLLTSVESLADLNRRLRARGQPAVDMQRFRPNVVIAGLRPYEEDAMRRVRIGGVDFWVWQRCGRCKMVTIDRDTLEHGPEPLATLSTYRERAHGQRNFGVHLVPIEGIPPGGEVTIPAGASVEVVEWDESRRAEWRQRHGG